MAEPSRKSRYRLPPLKWLMAFEAAARHMNFTAAAAELGLTQAAISYQIASLEKQLGYLLFERRPRQLRLTEMGHAYLPSVRKAFNELLAASSGLFGPLGEQSVTLRVTVSFAVLALAPRLRQFKALFPSINMRLWTIIWSNEPQSQPADLEIRFGEGTWAGFESSRLTQERAIIVCNPQFARRLKSPADLDRLDASELIGIPGQTDLWLRMLDLAGVPPRASAGYRIDTSLATAEVAISGIGCAIMLERFARPYLRAGSLVTPLDLSLPLNRAHYLLTPIGTSRLRPEVSLARKWLGGIDWDDEA